MNKKKSKFSEELDAALKRQIIDHFEDAKRWKESRMTRLAKMYGDPNIGIANPKLTK